MKYILLLDQGCEGCDHTIGCGKTWKEFKAPDYLAAVVRSQEIVREYGCGDHSIKKATLLVIQSEEILNIQDLWRPILEQKRKEEEVKIRAWRKAEYEKLKREFGNE